MILLDMFNKVYKYTNRDKRCKYHAQYLLRQNSHYHCGKKNKWKNINPEYKKDSNLAFVETRYVADKL